MFVVSVFRREVDENRALLGYYAACSCSPYRSYGTTYWSHIQGSKIHKASCILDPCPETSARNCHYTRCNSPEERRSKSDVHTLTLHLLA